MLGKFIECEADRNGKYYRVIQTEKEYIDRRRFPINEVVECDTKVDVNAIEIDKVGGFCISTYDFVFRWLIRGDTLCEVIIPEDTKIYKSVSNNGIYKSDKMILRNPRKIDDDFAYELYKASNLPEKSYFRAMAACAICGYEKTAIKVFEDKVTKENINIAINEFEEFCKRREEENLAENVFELKTVKNIKNKLKNTIDKIA